MQNFKVVNDKQKGDEYFFSLATGRGQISVNFNFWDEWLTSFELVSIIKKSNLHLKRRENGVSKGFARRR